MKLILLRHEERSFDIGFNSNLTETGVLNSYNLILKLKNEKIDIIFASPFIRVLQTIHPYCFDTDKKVNVEYGLYEYLHNPYFLLTKWYNTINDIEDINLKNIINTNYSSVVNKDDLIVLENEINLEKRIKKFFNYLLENYENKTILIVTHKAVVNKIKDIYVEETDISSEFEMGKYIILQQINYLQHNTPLN